MDEDTQLEDALHDESFPFTKEATKGHLEVIYIGKEKSKEKTCEYSTCTVTFKN